MGGLVLSGMLALAGCQGVVATLINPGSERLSGTLVADLQPIAGAKLQLYAAGSGGDGSAATPLIKSTVSTNASGVFDLTGTFSCPSSITQVYLVATAASHAVTPQLTLMKALGSCGNVTHATNLDISEATTVASTFALTPYMKSYNAVGSTSVDLQQMVGAFSAAVELSNAALTDASGIGVSANFASSTAKLKSLGTMLASCVNTAVASGDSSACGSLFSMAALASYGTPTDTVGALLDIARDPVINVTSAIAVAGSVPVAAPTFSTTGGTYAAAQSVSITSPTAGATIYYTANGSTPTSASTIYTSPIKVNSNETLQAIALLGSSNSSPVASASYVINLPQATPAVATQVKARATVQANADVSTQATTTVNLSSTVQTAGIDRPGVNIGGLGGYGSQQLFKSLNYVNGGYFPGTYAGTTYPCRNGGSNTTTTWYNDTTHPDGYQANYWAGATFDAINANTGTSYGQGTVTASTSNRGASGTTFSLSPAISSPCNPDQNDVIIVRLTKQNTLLSPYQVLNQHVCTDATWNTGDTSPESQNTQQSLQMPNGCGLTFYIDATVTNRTNTNSSLASQQTPYLNLNGSYNATFKAKCLTSGCSINFSLGRLGGTTFVGNTTVNPASNGGSGAGWTTYNYPFTASENGTQAQTIGYSFTCNGTCLMQDADVIEGSTLPGNTTVFRDAVVYELQKLHPGSIRYMDGSQWCSDVADQIATTGNRRWCGASDYLPGVGQGIGYNDVLALANFIGSDALISVGALNKPADWQMLINWLSSSGWTSTFAQSGHTIYLEDGNEAWNSGVGATLYFGNGQAYGYTLGPNMAAAKSASGYNSKVIKLVGNSWVAGNQGYGQFGWAHNILELAKKTPNGLPDFVDLAPYMLNYLANFDTSGSNVSTTGAPFLDEWAENANIDSVTNPVSNTESMYLNQQYAKSTYGVNTLVYEVNFSTLSGAPASQLQLDQIGASVGNALATSQHALLMQRDSGVIGPIHIFTLAEPYTGYTCNGCNGSAVMPLWGINHLMGTGPGQAPGSVTADRPLSVALQVINNAIGSNSNLMSVTQTGTPTFSYPGGQPQNGSNSIVANSAVPYVNCFSYSNSGATSWTVICFNNNLTTAQSVSLTGAGAPTGSVSQTIFPGASNVITDHNENTFMGSGSAAPVVTLPSPTTVSGTNFTIPPASFITLTYGAGAQAPTPTLATPTLSLGSGTYTGTQTVNINFPAGSTGCVGINTTPTAPTAGTCGSGGSTYTGAITVNSSQTVSAIATQAGSINSAIASATYTLSTPVAATPSFSIAAGTYTSTQSVSITDATAGTTIYYTTNGSTPTTSSSVYGGAISVATSQTIQAIAVKSGYTNSSVASAAYTINPVLPAPLFSVAGGTYTSAQTVSLTDAIAGATIYYTTNGSTPTTSSSVYGGAISVATSQTIQAIAVESGYTNSTVASAAYTINIPIVAAPTVSTACFQGSGSSTLNIGPLNTTGASTIALVVASFNVIQSVTDNMGNGNATGLTAANGNSPNNQIFYWQTPKTGSGHTITVNGGGGLYASACVFVMTGVTGTYSGAQNANYTGYGSSSCQTGITPPSGPQVIITGFGTYAASGAPTIDSSYIVGAYQPGTPGQAFGEAAGYLIQPAGTATSPRWNWPNVGSSPSCVIASFAGGTGTPAAATPVISPAGGTFTSTQSVSITNATSGNTIYYTTDGSTPTTSSNVYSGAINVTSSQTIQAIAVANGYSSSPVASAAFTINSTLPAPSFSLVGGTYTSTQSVSINDAVAGTIIYYTTNGSTPTTNSSVYGGSISVSSSQTLQAIAVKSGYTNSPVASAAYTINITVPQLAAPVFTPVGGTYTSAQSVNITDATPGATIYYTTNGTAPTTSSNVFSSSVNVATSQTLQAIAVKSGYTNSPIAASSYTINLPASSGPTVTTACYQGSGASSLTVGPLNTTGANAIALVVASFDVISSVTDNMGNGKAIGLTAAKGGNPNNQIFYWQTPNVGSSHTITVNGNNGLYASACVFVMSGVSGVYSGAQNANSANYGSSTCQTGIAPSSGPQVVITGFGVYTPSGAPTLDSAYTLGAYQPGAGGSAFGEAAGYLIQPSGTATSPVWNWPNSSSSPGCVIAAFGGGAGTGTPVTPTLTAPAFSIAGGTYTSTQYVSLSDAKVDATIYYTTNGSAPTTSSSIYTGPITVAASQTIQAIAVANGYNNSPVASASYTINIATTPVNPGGGATYINFASGQFTASSFSLNGSPSVSSGGVLQVTDGRYGEQSAAWFNTRVPVGNFTTDFNFQSPYANGDGMTFAIQGQGPTAIGAGGSGLGYQGINNSIAIKFDLYDNGGEGINSTGLYSNGAAPLTPAVDLSKTGIDLHSGHIIHAHMVYDGSNLTMTLTDTVTNGTAVQVFSVNIPAIVGSSTAYVGFTGGTGGVAASQNILTWSYTSN